MTKFDTPIDRNGTHAYKWDLRSKLFGSSNAIPLWVADMDLPCPEEVTAQLQARAAHPIYGYTIRPHSYFEALCAWVEKRHGWTIEERWCLHSPTVISSLSLAVAALTEPGERVLTQTPVYAPFYGVIHANNRELADIPLIMGPGTASPDFALLEREASHPSAKLLLLCNPHNPIGRVWSKDELSRIADICLRHDIKVVSDEIHSDLIYSGHRHIPFASLAPEVADITITCFSPSKTFNLAGLGASAIVVSNPHLRSVLQKAIDRWGIGMTNCFAVAAFEAAYRHGERWLQELLQHLEANRDFLVSFMRNNISLLDIFIPEATYLAWIDCHRLNLDGEKIGEFFVKNANVALEPGAKFGQAGEKFQRLNFACPKPVLEQALAQIKAAVENNA